jgi:hypothetical protein
MLRLREARQSKAMTRRLQKDCITPKLAFRQCRKASSSGYTKHG